MGGWADRWMGGWTDGRTNRRTDRQTHRHKFVFNAQSTVFRGKPFFHHDRNPLEKAGPFNPLPATGGVLLATVPFKNLS